MAQACSPCGGGHALGAQAGPTAIQRRQGGRFHGFGAAQVSKGEKEMLEQVRAAVSQA
jgi:hypothetical protein